MTTSIDISQWVSATAVLVVLLYLFALTMRFIAQKQPQTALGMKRKRLKLSETLHLDARNKVCLVELDGKEMVIAVGLNGTTFIKEQNAPQTEVTPQTDKKENA